MKQKTVHLDKAVESVKKSNKAENHYWEDGELVVQFKQRGYIDQLINELNQWGLEVKEVAFPMNSIRFKQK